MHSLRCFAVSAFLAAMAASGPVARASGLVLTEGTFDPANWTFSFHGPAGSGSGGFSQQSTGGNPDYFSQIYLQQTTGDALKGVLMSSNLTYNPATQGAIGSLSMVLEVKEISGYQQAFGLALKQGENLFVTWGDGNHFLSNSTPWDSHVLNGLTSTAFGLVSGASSMTPDFSASGAPMTFGYWVGNSGSPGFTIHGGADNLQVAVMSAVPEPSTYAAIAGAIVLAGTVVYRRRRTRGQRTED